MISMVTSMVRHLSWHLRRYAPGRRGIGIPTRPGTTFAFEFKTAPIVRGSPAATRVLPITRLADIGDAGAAAAQTPKRTFRRTTIPQWRRRAEPCSNQRD